MKKYYDVVVIGGTTAAVSAAIAAKKAGANTLVISPRPYFGTDLTEKLLLNIDNSKWPAGIFAAELFCILDGPFVSYGNVTPLAVKRLCDEVLAKYGVEAKTYTAVTDVVRDKNGCIAGVRIVSRGHNEILRCKTVIDATERAYIARRAGAEFSQFSGGVIEFERRVIAGEAPVADGMSVTELRSVNTVTRLQGVPQAPAESESVTGRFYSCKFPLEMDDLSATSLAEAEQKARDMTWVKSTLDASNTLRFFPPDRIVRSADGLFVASLVGEPDEEKAIARFEDIYTDSRAAEAIGDAAAKDALNRQEPGEPVIPDVVLPVIAECDVFVAGAGTGGAPAAVTAAREGAKTIVCDYLYCTGGLMTEGLIGSYCHGYRGGFTAEIEKGLKGFGDVYSVAKSEWFRQEARKAGASIWFGAWIDGVTVEETDGSRKITAAEVVLPDGSRGIVKAKVFIDASGNADLAAAAGEETEFIRNDELSLQGAGSTPKLLGASYRNTDYAFVDDTDAEDMAFFTTRARTSMPLWAWDQAQIVNSRERRRMKGAFSLSVQDALLNRTYPDIIAITCSDFDTHGQTFDDQFFIEDPGHGRRTVYLPYRCFLPKELEGLLVIGLGMSAHRDAMPILRMQPDVQNQGYVAGLAAAMSIRDNVEVRNVNMPELQRRLVEKECIPAELAGCADNFPLYDEAFDAAAKSLTENYKGLTVLLSDAQRALPRLRAGYAETHALQYAHLLGLLGDDTGVDTLIKVVDETEAWDKGWNYRGMDQFGRSVSWLDTYIIATGRTRAAKAFNAVVHKAELLVSQSEYSHFRAIALALESLGDKRGISVLEHLMNLDGVCGHSFRDDGRFAPVPGYSKYTRRNMGIADDERSYCLRELCLARALFNLGDTEGHLGEKTLRAYAADPRRAYANHAKMILKIS